MPQRTLLIAVSEVTLRRAQQDIWGCQSCSQTADVPFRWVLNRVTGRTGEQTDYVLPGPAMCPRCMEDVVEGTLVVWM